MTTMPGRAAACSAAHDASKPPTAICPSAPILVIRARKHRATPTPARMYGVLLLRANPTRSVEPNAPLISAQYAASGLLPEIAISTAVIASASATAMHADRKASEPSAAKRVALGASAA